GVVQARMLTADDGGVLRRDRHRRDQRHLKEPRQLLTAPSSWRARGGATRPSPPSAADGSRSTGCRRYDPASAPRSAPRPSGPAERPPLSAARAVSSTSLTCLARLISSTSFARAAVISRRTSSATSG